MEQKSIEGIHWRNLEIEDSKQRVRLVRLLTIYGGTGEFLHFPILEWQTCEEDSDFFRGLGYCWNLLREDVLAIFPTFRRIETEYGYDILVKTWNAIIKEYPNFFLEKE